MIGAQINFEHDGTGIAGRNAHDPAPIPRNTRDIIIPPLALVAFAGSERVGVKIGLGLAVAAVPPEVVAAPAWMCPDGDNERQEAAAFPIAEPLGTRMKLVEGSVATVAFPEALAGWEWAVDARERGKAEAVPVAEAIWTCEAVFDPTGLRNGPEVPQISCASSAWPRVFG